jgi:hypothetical protein
MANTGIVNIDGKDYRTVALRIHQLRQDHPDAGIETSILQINQAVILVKATISKDGVVLATGHAEEWRDSSQINQHAAVECAETSAVGRALAFLGYLGDVIYTEEELVNKRMAQGRTIDRGSGYPDSGYEQEKPTEKQIGKTSAESEFEELTNQLSQNNFRQINAQNPPAQIPEQAFCTQVLPDRYVVIATTQRTRAFLEALGFTQDPQKQTRYIYTIYKDCSAQNAA